jgi:hypothetical protein
MDELEDDLPSPLSTALDERTGGSRSRSLAAA